MDSGGLVRLDSSGAKKRVLVSGLEPGLGDVLVRTSNNRYDLVTRSWLGAGHDNSLRHVSFIPPNKYYSDSNTVKDKKNTQHKRNCLITM